MSGVDLFNAYDRLPQNRRRIPDARPIHKRIDIGIRQVSARQISSECAESALIRSGLGVRGFENVFAVNREFCYISQTGIYLDRNFIV